MPEEFILVKCPHCRTERAVFAEDDPALLKCYSCGRAFRFTPSGGTSDPQPTKGDAVQPSRCLNDFTGQTRIRQALSIAIEAARQRGEAMGHVLLIGSPGRGKKTLARIIAEELQVPCTVTSGSAMKRTLDLGGILSNIRARQVLLIDNINDISPSLKPMLTSALNDFRLDIQVGAGPNVRTHSIPMPRFTLVGTSCKPAIKGIPTDTFSLVLTLSEYTADEMAVLVSHAARRLDIAIDITGAMELGRRAHGTPGEISRLLRIVRDYAQVRSSGTVTADIVRKALEFIGSVTPRNQPFIRPDAAETTKPLTPDINRPATDEEIGYHDESLRNERICYESNKIWEKWGFNDCEEPFDGIWDDDAHRRHLQAVEEIAIRLEQLGLLSGSAYEVVVADERIPVKTTANTRRGLSRVAGMMGLKEQLTHEVIQPFENPELYSRYRVALPNGILFFGPPGCGKTYLARSLAEELGWHFQYCRPSDVASPYIHDTVNRIRAVFAAAIEKAPSIIFIDEFEAFVPARSDLGGHQQYKAEEVNEFLANLEGCAERKVLVIAATNEPERIDPAVRRSGRFDKLILIPPPDAVARRAMLEFHLRDRPIVASLDVAGISAVLEGYSASDIKLLTDEAARIALKRKALIDTRMLLAALERVPPSITAEDMQRFEGFRSRGT